MEYQIGTAQYQMVTVRYQLWYWGKCSLNCVLKHVCVIQDLLEIVDCVIYNTIWYYGVSNLILWEYQIGTVHYLMGSTNFGIKENVT